MPSHNPRVNVVLEKPLFDILHSISKKEGVSMSLKVRDFIKNAIEEYEDSYLVDLAENRLKTWHPSKVLKHETVWAHLKKRK